MEVQGAAERKRTKRGSWSAEQRREIVAASFVAGASINKVDFAITLVGGKLKDLSI
jgi:hypothetical protein